MWTTRPVPFLSPRRRPLAFLGGLALCLALACPAAAQQILIDKPVRAGELILFPDLGDPNTYYYVSDKPSLALDANGRPQFSFLRYVENVRSGADQPEAREGEGGGIVHAVVSLSVSREQLADAQRGLQRLKPGARIVGPVVYKSGRFSLVSSFKDPQGGLTTQVVGLGAAPLLDGERAAVSMQLTKKGAKILWESFNTPTPDISFSFEMEVVGFRSPHRALLEANFDQIYEHQGFSAGLASTYLSAEIRGSFDDLRREGAIKLTQVGENEQLDQLIQVAYQKITEMMFQPSSGTGTPDLASLAGSAGGNTSLLDRATTQLNTSRAEARRENERIRRENREAEERERARPRGETAPGGGTAAGESQPAPTENGAAAGEEQPPVHARNAGLRQPDQPLVEPRETASRQQEETVPSVALVASFEMRRVRQRGTFTIDLNKSTADSITLRFDSNIGDLTRLRGDQNHFREVNLDDPLFRQREIVAFLDGLNAQDFGQYINFVTVEMRKKHATGDLTSDEIRIDRNNFSSAGNNWKLLYGWKGDNDRRRWMEYEYRALWSFFGGKTLEDPWKPSTFGALNLAPPYQRRIIQLDGDPESIQNAQVRLITVKVFYDLGSGEQVRQVSLNAAKGQLSERLEILLPANQTDYQYEITWRLRGDRTVNSGRKTSSDSILFVDEVPGG